MLYHAGVNPYERKLMVDVEVGTRSLAGKIAEVQAELVKLDKGGTVQLTASRGYNYAEEPDLMEYIRPKVADKNVALLVDFPEMSYEGNMAVVKVRLRAVDGDSDETYEWTAWGSGTDPNDKAIYKAMTGGTRYVLQKAFLIATDDPEQQEQSSVPREVAPRREGPITEKQRKLVFAKSREHQISEETMRTIIRMATNDATDRVTDFPNQKFDRLLKMIDAYAENPDGAETAIRSWLVGKGEAEEAGSYE